MSPCGRGCCFTGLGVCARQRTCPCHWTDQAPREEPRHSDARRHRDPTAQQAVRNVMNHKKKRK